MGHIAEASLQQEVIGNCTAGKCRDRCLSNQTTNRVVYVHTDFTQINSLYVQVSLQLELSMYMSLCDLRA